MTLFRRASKACSPADEEAGVDLKDKRSDLRSLLSRSEREKHLYKSAV